MTTETLPFRLLLSACANVATAEQIAGTLVEEGLAACVTLLPGARSIYRWQGKLRSEERRVGKECRL